MPVVSPLAVEYWELNENSSPVYEFIAIVEPDGARAKIQSTIKMLEDVGMGLLTNPRVFKKLADNLYELRIRWGKARYRILVVIRKAVAYLVHAFTKQKERELQHIRLGLQRRDIIMAYSATN